MKDAREKKKRKTVKVKEEYGYNSPFPKALRQIMDDKNVTQEELAAICGVQRQSVSLWQNGASRPDILTLKNIANYFNVSTDYLLGLSDTPTPNIDMQGACLLTGLSQNAIEKLKSWNSESEVWCSYISLILEDPTSEVFLSKLRNAIISEKSIPSLYIETNAPISPDRIAELESIHDGNMWRLSKIAGSIIEEIIRQEVNV